MAQGPSSCIENHVSSSANISNVAVDLFEQTGTILQKSRKVNGFLARKGGAIADFS